MLTLLLNNFCQEITDAPKISDVIVSGRNSTFAYKGSPVEGEQIAKELKVRHNLEGSVLKSQNRLRVTAKLVDNLKGHRLWTKQYEREIKDLFALLDELTNEIVLELQVKLILGEQVWMWAKGTTHPEAWDYVRRSLRLPLTNENNITTRELFSQAVKIDPNYAAAWAGLALTYIFDVSLEWTDSLGEIYKKTYQSIQKALELDDKNPLAHVLMGIVHNWNGQHGKAIVEGEKGVSLGPNNGLVHACFALIMSNRSQLLHSTIIDFDPPNRT